ncbi:hypothetical protein [Fibrella aquatilis]|uniref:Uncharacterized protein n=1 Tax=Fibrella aquatilis TaxID=2817059 RepID=A0A939G4U6_9BACT|nr:hypothetical protein [Fibrella aquatilis]MBO0930036.1 hypothetical protein [Fibrella aquatilis]
MAQSDTLNRIKHSIGVEYARVFFSRGDIWGDALRIQHNVSFGKQQLINLQTSVGMLQKQRYSSEAGFGSGLQAAYYSFDLGPKLNIGLLGSKISLMAGYAWLWGNELQPGYAVGIVKPGDAVYFLVEPREPAAIFVNKLYDGPALQMQIAVPLNERFSIAVTGRTLIVYTKEQRDQFFTARINNMTASLGIMAQYAF